MCGGPTSFCHADGCGTLRSCAARANQALVWRWQAGSWRRASKADARQDAQARQTTAADRTVQRVVDLALAAGRNTTDRPNAAKAGGVSLRSVQRILEAHQLAPHRIRTFKLSNDPNSPRNSRTSSASMSILRPCGLLSSTKRADFSARPTSQVADEAGPCRRDP